MLRIRGSSGTFSFIDAKIQTADATLAACPLGNAEVLGVRTCKRASPDVVGRVRRNRRLTP